MSSPPPSPSSSSTPFFQRFRQTLSFQRPRTPSPSLRAMTPPPPPDNESRDREKDRERQASGSSRASTNIGSFIRNQFGAKPSKSLSRKSDPLMSSPLPPSSPTLAPTIVSTAPPDLEPPVPTRVPSPLPTIETLLVSLTPPTSKNLSPEKHLACAVEFNRLLTTSTLTPTTTAIIPIITCLCSSDSPPLLRKAGYDLITIYLTLPSTTPLSTLDRASFWDIIRTSETTTSVGTSDELALETEWTSRFAALEKLTFRGREVEGFTGLVQLVAEWAKNAASAVITRLKRGSPGLAQDNADDYKLNMSLSFLTEFLKFNASLMEDKEVVELLDVFEGILRTSLSVSETSARNVHTSEGAMTLDSSTQSSNPSASPPSRSSSVHNLARSNTQTHRRHPSSLSTPATAQLTLSRPPYILPAKLYLTHLSRTLELCYLPPSHLFETIKVLTLLFSYVMTPLPPLSLSKRDPPPLPLESDTWGILQSLLSGPFATATTRILKQLILAPSPSGQLGNGHALEFTSSKPNSVSIRIAEGCARTMRLALRLGAESRLARSWLNNTYNWNPSGAPVISADGNMMDLAWGHREGEGAAWEISHISGVLKDCVKGWVRIPEANRIGAECVGIVDDLVTEIITEIDERGFSEEEGEIVGEVLFEAVKYVRFESDWRGIPSILPLDSPSPLPCDPMLAALVALIPRIPFSSPLTPSLPQILLSIAPHLSDQTSKSLVEFHVSEGLLSPSSTDWLPTLSQLFESLYLPSRPLARRALASAAKEQYQSVRDLKDYRDPLLRLCLDIWEKEDAEDDHQVISDAWAVLGDGVVAIASDEVPEERGNEDMAERIRVVICAVAARYPCPYTANHSALNTATATSTGPPSPEGSRTPVASSSASSPPTSLSSSFPSPDSSDSGNNYQRDTTTPTSMRPLMSLITSLTSPPSRDVAAEQPPPPIPRSTRPNVLIPTLPSHGNACKSLTAVLTLIDACSRLAFSPPQLLGSPSRTARAPASYQCILLFRDLLALLSSAEDPDRPPNLPVRGRASCSHARLAILQWLVRLRADRDHRLYILQDMDVQLQPLAAIIARIKRDEVDRTQVPPIPDEPEIPARVARNRSYTQGGTENTPREGRDRTSRSRRDQSRGRRDESRSQSRHPYGANPQPPPPPEPIWGVPDVLPFDILIGTRPSEGMTTYEARTTEPPSVNARLWLPTSSYVRTLTALLQEERDWELVSYVLCHLPLQLTNKHLFCGPLTKSAIISLATTLRKLLISDAFVSYINFPSSQTLRPADVYNIAYHSFTILISYRKTFDRSLLEGMIEAFIHGLTRAQTTTAKSCLQALSLCAYELESYMNKFVNQILQKLSQLNSNPALAVHILEFLYVVGSVPSLYVNLREDDYNLVFGVALKYIQNHNRPGPVSLSTSGGAQVGGLAFSLTQHVLALSYRVVYVWFLVLKPSERPKYIPFITKALVKANEPKSEIDEPSEVCFDWLARNTYGNVRPQPVQSYLGGRVAGLRQTHSSRYTFGEKEKTWMLGFCYVTIRTLTRPGWVELTSRRPSGCVRFLCKLENVASLGLGDDIEEDLSIPLDEERPSSSGNGNADPTHDSTGEREATLLSMRTETSWSAPSPPSPPSTSKSNDVELDPSFLPLQLSVYPSLRQTSGRWRLLPNDNSLAVALSTIDHIPIVDQHKIGVMYVAPGQTQEVEILGNCHGSPAYTRFLDGLGSLLRLKGQKEIYGGDLDSENDEDGEYTYAWWNDLVQVVYHIATLMPNRPGDSHFTWKKRHVGNDWVRVVWNDSGKEYRFDTLFTSFQLVNILIEPHSLGPTAAYIDDRTEHEFFKVSCQRQSGMPEVGPIGEFKLVSAECLPSYIKHCCLLSSLFAGVYQDTDRDKRSDEYITVWRQRLRMMKLYRDNNIAELKEGDEYPEPSVLRDFTKVF